MKKLKQIITQIKSGAIEDPAAFNDMIWQLICYPPKMPVRLQQQQLLDEAEKFSLAVNDEYFAKRQLTFNGFKWGSGSRKILITHGWASKAADFTEMITALREIDDVQIIAFDAPGNGSSEGDLSNLLLYVQAVEAVITKFSRPDVVIGHSFGCMANVVALQQMTITPRLLVSIAPLIRLKENFEASMNAVGIVKSAQETFLQSFEDDFGFPASFNNLNTRYSFDEQLNHLLLYDENDLVSPYDYLKEFLDKYPSIKSKSYGAIGHERIIKSADVINDVMEAVNTALNN